jgi:heptosyltransferase-2
MEIYPKKVLVINRLGIGDIIISTPIIKALRDKYPDSHITFLVRSIFEDVVRDMPYIDDYVLYEKGDNMFALLKRVWRYDIAFCLDFKYRSAVLATLACIPIRVGFKRKRGLFLTHCVDDDPLEDETYQPIIFARMIKQCIGIDLGEDMNTLFIPSPNKDQVKKVDKIFQDINAQNELLISVAPYSSTPEKDWPLEYYKQLFALLKEKYSCKIIVLGAPHDKSKPQSSNVYNLIGETSLIEMSEIIRRSNLFIGGCSGPLHIAGATGAPIVAIYTATSPQQWAPRQNTTVVYSNLSCSPCINKGVVCSHYKCTYAVKVDEVFNACQSVLQDH